jgi:hypothetical protein
MKFVNCDIDEEQFLALKKWEQSKLKVSRGTLLMSI